ALDISVAKSNLDSIKIELADTQQTIIWLEKSIQEIENQLNVLSIFGRSVAQAEINNSSELRIDANYQKNLVQLEKSRLSLLKKLQNIASNILGLRNETYSLLNTLLKSRNLIFIKQQQVKDELAYQEQQNY